MASWSQDALNTRWVPDACRRPFGGLARGTRRGSAARAIGNEPFSLMTPVGASARRRDKGRNTAAVQHFEERSQKQKKLFRRSTFGNEADGCIDRTDVQLSNLIAQPSFRSRRREQASLEPGSRIGHARRFTDTGVSMFSCDARDGNHGLRSNELVRDETGRGRS